MQKFKKKKFYKHNFKNNQNYKKNNKNLNEIQFFFFGKNITKNKLKFHKNLKKKYFYKVKNKKRGVLLNLPNFKNLSYPYPFNFKLINEMLKK